VHVEPHTSLVFLLEGGRRITLRRQNGDFVSKDRRYSAAELMDLAEHLSPNALLRPVVQDFMLPTVSYVGGPAELAYMAQSQVLYKELLPDMPVMIARSGFTLLDQRTKKLMDRYQLTLPNFFQGDESIAQHVGQRLVPADLLREFEQVQKSTAKALSTLRDDLVAFDPTLAAAAEKSSSKIAYQLSKIQQKTAREASRRNERGAAEVEYMSGLIFPEKHLQERFYSILPFIAKHGFGLLDTLYEHIHLDCPDHKILVV
jgi:bacillithiol synthase